MVNLISLNEIDYIFSLCGYSRISCDNGFFYYNGLVDTAIYFNINEKSVSIYEYETGASIDVGFKVLDTILHAFRILGWYKE